MTTSDLPKKTSLIWIWLSLRSYSFLCGIFAAHLAGTTLLTMWERWDTVYYARIALAGYSAVDGTTNFHPLFPWLARPFALLSGAPVVGLLLVSSIASLSVYITFESLSLIDQDRAKARKSTLLFIFWPVSYILYLPYAESLWLLCAIVSFICARRERWWFAGLAAALATLTRQQGLFLMAPLAWELWLSADSQLRKAALRWRDWLALMLIPLSYLGWILYRTVSLGEENPNYSGLRAFIFSTLISPASRRVVKEHEFLLPWDAAYLALKRALTVSFVNPWIDLILGSLFLLFILLAWRGMRTSYRIYVVLIAIVSFSFHTGMTSTGGAYLSLPRHLLLAFPVFIGLGARWHRLPTWLLIAGGTMGMTFLLFGYFWVRLVP